MLRPAFSIYLFFVYFLVNSVSFAEDFSYFSMPTSPKTTSEEITSLLNLKQNVLLERSNFENRAEDVEALYKSNNYEPIWLANSQSEKNIADVFALLSNAASQGLNANDYSVAILQQKLPFIQLLKPEAAADLALFDTALTISLTRFLHDVHYGRVNPRSLNFYLKLRTKKTIDLPQLIKTAIAEGTVLQLTSKFEPTLAQYQKLRSELATYREPVVLTNEVEEKPHKKSKSKKAVNYSERITKIELAMERLRWLPEISAEQSIIVNIPAFQLWGIGANGEELNLNVVVGKSEKTQTPIIMADMKFVEFMPYWNVPPSILKKEILPKLANNPGYLSGQNMEVVSLKGGGMRVRQRPGGKNALGRIKFIFPNKEGVYLHDTPSKALFSRPRRDFSHGCVRVQNPSALANFVLKNQEGWTSEKITASLSSNTHHQISLSSTIPVLFFYSTAFYEQGDKLVFYNDIYGHDAALLAALSKINDVPDSVLIHSEPDVMPIQTLPTEESPLFSEPSPE
ncbi:MAG: L,D-transpeptidase family protein [Methylococcaceae bacterium]